MNLTEQIAQEAKELKDAPVIPKEQLYFGPVQRCGICGRLTPVNELEEFDTHIRPARKRCKECKR